MLKFPNIPKKKNISPKPKPERVIKSQCFGMFLTVMLVLLFSLVFLFSLVRFFLIESERLSIFQVIFFFMSAVSFLYFYLRLAFDKNYCSGNPGIIKMWPNFAGTVLVIVSATFVSDYVKNGEKFENLALTLSILSAVIFLGLNLMTWLCFFGDDEGDSCFLCCKPWRSFQVSHFGHMMNGQNYQQYPQVYPPTQVQYSYPTQVQHQYPTQAQNSYPNQVQYSYPTQVQDPGQNYHQQYPQVYPTT